MDDRSRALHKAFFVASSRGESCDPLFAADDGGVMGDNVSEGIDLMDTDPAEEHVAASSSSAVSIATVGRLFEAAGVMFNG